MESCNVSTVGLNVCWARSRHDRSPQCHRSNLEFLLLGFTHMSSAATLFALLLFFGADHKSPFCAAWFILWSFGQPSTHSLPFGEPCPCQVPCPLRATCGHVGGSSWSSLPAMWAVGRGQAASADMESTRPPLHFCSSSCFPVGSELPIASQQVILLKLG